MPASSATARKTRIPASEIVPGDVLMLAEGDNIPADARVVEEYGLRTNNATLTGEAIPARKTADASLRSDLTELERPNLVFAGTSVVSGTGQGGGLRHRHADPVRAHRPPDPAGAKRRPARCSARCAASHAASPSAPWGSG